MEIEKPNVVLVITDDQGYGDLGCHGNGIIRTPHMDALHGQSVRLRQFHVGPTCAPTRAGLMTGRYCNCTGVWHTIAGWSMLRAGEVTLAEVLREAGYRTGLFGKWHLGDNYPFRPHDRGFDEALYHRGGGISQAPDWWRNDYFDDTYYRNGTPERHQGYCTDVWFREGIRFIERCCGTGQTPMPQNRPFFCYIAPNAPHGPLNVPPRYIEPYRGKVPDHRARFYAMIENIDENLGRLRTRLDELGLAHNTIFIFMTDNGTADGCDLDAQSFVTGGYNAGMRGVKGSEYDGGHRTPLFVRWPAGGLTGGRDVTRLTANIDVLPTLADLCGGSVPEGVYGRSIVPLLRGDGEGWPDRVIVTDSQRVETPQKWRKSATMTDRWRLVNGVELYDIQADPGQRRDVAGEHGDVVSRLRGEYEKWWQIVSEKFNDEPAIVLGTAHEPVARLSSHDWHTPEGFCPWNQGDVRHPQKLWKGYWAVDVAAAGRYEFELCRWPHEVPSSITQGIADDAEEPLPKGIQPGAEGWYVGGCPMAVRSATIEIAGQVETAPVAPDSRGAVFTLELPAGRTSLWATFTDAHGQQFGAFYVYVRRVEAL
ncbi:MAG: arylsulfatase [Planctomycetaceae bacterium]|nr:arylsulfatase [Planctomycetaceae bacterium]